MPPEKVSLAGDTVQVWCASLDLPAAFQEQLEDSLSADERARAAGYRFERDRRRFIARRGMLRLLLARYSTVEAARLRFTYNDYGKPALAAGSGPQALRFNLSLSAGLGLFAFAWGREIGVDIESLRSDFDFAEIAGRFFSPNERAALQAMPAASKGEAFFACWTRKEAYIKAYGQGLSLPLDSFDVSIELGGPAALLATRHDPAQARRWRLAHLSPAPGYTGALVVEGHDWQLDCWHLRVGSLTQP